MIMSVLSAILLIPACAVGAGLLSFPVLTGLSGFLPSSMSILLCWAFSTFTGLIIVELACFLHDGKKDLHFFSINEKFLPHSLRLLGLCLFLFMCYGSLIGYVAAVGPTMKAFINFTITDKTIGALSVCLLFFFTLLNNKKICIINNIFTPVMLISYVVLLVIGFNFFTTDTLMKHADLSSTYIAIPTIVTAFSFQFIVPSLVNILGANKKLIRASVVIGTSINCVIYLIWNMTMLGCIPIEQIMKAYHASIPVTAALTSNALIIAGNIFAFFALLTSFFSINLSIKDYWKDHMKINNGMLLNVMVFLPVLCIFLIFDKLFLWIFSVTGGYGDTVLFGILPFYMLMVAKKQGYKVVYPYWSLMLMVLFSLIVFGIQLKMDFLSILG